MPICDVCRKRVETVYDPNMLLGFKAFKIWVSACMPCIDRQREEMIARKENRRQMKLDSGDFP